MEAVLTFTAAMLVFMAAVLAFMVAVLTCLRVQWLAEEQKTKHIAQSLDPCMAIGLRGRYAMSGTDEA